MMLVIMMTAKMHKDNKVKLFRMGMDFLMKLPLIFYCRYIKEGSTVSVMGVVQRNDNVLMIVPPPEPLTTGCQWAKCIFPASLEGIVLRCEDTSKIDVIPV